jgi:S1-C subfamily serine protease
MKEMDMTKSVNGLASGVLAMGLCWTVAPPALAQNPERVAKEEAVVVVDGVVRQVFRSSRQARTDYLVQIEVQRAEGRRAARTAVRPHYPAPGEVVYVHVFQPLNAAGFFGKGANSGNGYSAIPSERAQVRAFLVPADNGQWEGTYPDWFDLSSDQPARASKTDPSPAGGAGELPMLTGLGVTTEPLTVKDRFALRVKSVERGSPAHQAGLEVGDVIVGAKDEPLKSAGQLEELARRGESIPLIVLDVNTGRAAKVELRPAPKVSEPRADNAAPPPADRRSLGLSAEPVTLGQRTALKVTRVEPGGPAQKAGIEPGDVLVAANGAPVTSPEQLANAFRKSASTLTLTVRDSRGGREVPVQVAIGGGAADKPLPADVPDVSPAKGRLGAVTELTFYDVEAAVKVTEVEPGSPADRAGLRPGMVILEADGKVVLHPNELLDAARRSSGVLMLKVVDPRSGTRRTVDVNLGESR